MHYLIAFCSRPEAASDVNSGKFVGPIFPDEPAKFRNPCLNYSREIPIVGDIFDSFFRYNFPPEVNSDVMSGVAVEHVDMYVPVKFGESRPNGSRDILGTDFVSNNRTNMTEVYYIRQRRLTGDSPKTVVLG